MKTVSDAYKDAQNSSLIYPVRKVELYRRLADGSGWESAPTDVTTEVVRLDRLSWKLDTDALNEFKASNIRIEVENTDRRWDDDSIERFAGYLRFRSKIRISLGLKVDGAEEISPVFTGVIEDAVESSDKPTLQLDVESLDALLRTRTAESAAIPVTDELLGIGDGVISEFTTSRFPVGAIKEVRVGGVPVRLGLRYNASGLNDPSRPAKVSFVSIQPGPGEEVRADYLVWKKDQRIEQVASDLMAIVPQVPVALIEPVVFDPPAQRQILHSLQGDFEAYDLRLAKVVEEDSPPEDDGKIIIDPFDSRTEWETGTLSRINSRRVAGGIAPQWTSQYEGDFLPGDEEVQVEGVAFGSWQDLQSTPGIATRTASNGILSVSQAGLSDYFIKNGLEGTSLSRMVLARIRVTNVTASRVEIGTRVPGGSPERGASIWFESLSAVRVRTGGTEFGPFNVDVTQFHNYRLVLTMANANSGTWVLFIDGTQVGTGAVGQADLFMFPGIFLHSIAGSSGCAFAIDYLRFYGEGTTFPVGTWTLVIDYSGHLAGLVQASLINTLGPFFAVPQGNAAGSQFSFSWSADGTTYGTEQAVTIGANIGTFVPANAPRYVKFKIQITADDNPTLVAVRNLFLPALAVSNIIDAGSGVVSWETWKATRDTGNGSIKRFTAAVAATPSGFGYYRAVTPSDYIESDDAAQLDNAAAERLALITLMATSGLNSPALRETVIDFTTRTVLVSMVNLGTRTVWDVLTELAKIADFEIGLDGEGKFFFRNKSPGATPVLTLDGSNLEKVQSCSPGWDRVYNSIRSTFGSYVREIDPSTEGEPSPTSIDRFGARSLSVGGGSLVFQTDVDLATVMARRYFSRYKEPKRRATVVARFMPELELGDRVAVTLQIPRQILEPFEARILGVAHDLMNMRTELDLIAAD
ncbi:MAG: hypothetical protein A2992_06330 [Elusimicrobia bacterium RIFCSPLOWO2_01_FULL_59_12]|nr:MAG: hypothetical protein A2992_06330 [Elusimicrobia bacterium RIFCSPLOWO2_01_FULL_59_12]